jgi:phosphonate transport system substrate-binding protein
MRILSSLVLVFTSTAVVVNAGDDVGVRKSYGEPLVLKFGVYTSDRATEMYKTFSPLIDDISRSLTQQLSRPVDIELVISRTYEAAQKQLAAGEVHIARFGPASYVVTKEQEPGISIIAVEEVAEQTNFNGIVFVRADSGITSLDQLKGKTFAFGDKSSTIGRFLPQVALIESGIHAKDLKKYAYLERHDKVATAVLNGEYDAGAAKESTFAKYQGRSPGLKQLKILKNVTKPWLAKKDLDPAVIEALRGFLLAYHDEKVLKQLDDASGFQPGKDEDFDQIRKAMKAAKEFGD